VVRNQRGEQRRFRTELIAQQRVMISFIYTRCDGICPKTVANLVAVEKLLRSAAEPFRMLSLSVDPARDTPEDLAEYAQDHGVSHIPNWEFLVASPADTVAIQKALRASEPDADAASPDLKSHSGMIVFGNDATNRWSSIAAGTAPIHIQHAFQTVARTSGFSSLLKLRV
jgi:protein SCO1/2